jgi:hypothetical protein
VTQFKENNVKRINSVWTIGTYGGRDSLCVNLDFGGTRFHRHDFGGILPRAIRIGIFIEQIEKESGIRDYEEAYCNAVLSDKNQCKVGETISAALLRIKRQRLRVVR